MMYRAKITYCAPIIENIYGANYPYYLRDAKDQWIEVSNVNEADYIDYINECQRKTFQAVKKLEEIRK